MVEDIVITKTDCTTSGGGGGGGVGGGAVATQGDTQVYFVFTGKHSST